ncbi:MAG TPA: hypothetical protein VFV66_35935 [Nonomuraea sp.]|nr:hypothetical protein [Nonomuraea sp.]
MRPELLAIATPVVAGVHAAGVRGAAWALVVSVSAGVIPYVDARRRPIQPGAKSPQQVGVALISILGGLTITGVAVLTRAAPQEVLATHMALLAVAIAIALISGWRKWDISIHSATTATCAVIVFQEFGSPLVLAPALALLVTTTAWSRIHQGHHRASECLAGLTLGGTTSWMIYHLIT